MMKLMKSWLVCAMMAVGGLTVGVSGANADGQLVPLGQACGPTERVENFHVEQKHVKTFSKDLNDKVSIRVMENPVSGEWVLELVTPNQICLMAAGKDERA